MTRKGSAKWLREQDPALAEQLIPLLGEVHQQVMATMMSQPAPADSPKLARWKAEFAKVLACES